MASAGFAVIFDPLNGVERISIALTALLSEIFLQLGYNDQIPDGGEITVMDWIINWCYFTILLIVVEAIIAMAVMRKFDYRLTMASFNPYDDEKNAATVQLYKHRYRIARLIDTIFMIGLILLSTVGSVVVIIIAIYA